MTQQSMIVELEDRTAKRRNERSSVASSKWPLCADCVEKVGVVNGHEC